VSWTDTETSQPDLADRIDPAVPPQAPGMPGRQASNADSQPHAVRVGLNAPRRAAGRPEDLDSTVNWPECNTAPLIGLSDHGATSGPADGKQQAWLAEPPAGVTAVTAATVQMSGGVVAGGNAQTGTFTHSC
jgi:hypothetical protein